MYRHLLIIILLTGFAFSAMAQKPQTDTIRNKKDSLNMKRDSATSKRFVPKVTKEDKKYHPDSLHDPHKAVVRSLMIPGWGQLYNNQWWKVPIIYAGLGLLVDVVIFNQRQYGPLLIVARYYERGQTPGTADPQYALYMAYFNAGIPAQTVYDEVNGYIRNRDLGILGFMAAWGIQAVDAYIDAKFKHSYTMDTDFSFNIQPTIINQQAFAMQGFNGPIIPGLKLTFVLK
ncbi:DUF5683 domain-containing protein [Mucilaginibacter sp. X5P1]|uniref:DUF5683 domain-containing protein n=1 Tax=Mucilaginibacter sp. X5P1 TaxID=2723088 RepID=UPI0016133D5B|nr:DUF5683 domain-containing protein [Mucilaginibacter sp. X5P1]MBB6139549.1 hypothetical protein [Mucilaginibacter sp. X5P1]